MNRFIVVYDPNATILQDKWQEFLTGPTVNKYLTLNSGTLAVFTSSDLAAVGAWLNSAIVGPFYGFAVQYGPIAGKLPMPFAAQIQMPITWNVSVTKTAPVPGTPTETDSVALGTWAYGDNENLQPVIPAEILSQLFATNPAQVPGGEVQVHDGNITWKAKFTPTT